jgi:hypothetical protein
VPVRAPVLAQYHQNALREWHIAVFGSLAMSYMDDHTVAVNVTNLNARPFSYPQAASIDRAQARAIAGMTKATQNPAYFVRAEHHR